LTVTEQKIILYLVSQIHKDDDDFKMYSLPIQHFYELLGYRGSPKYSEMRDITRNLMREILEIKEGKKLKQMSWISYVEYDEHSGRVYLSFDPRLKPYLLQLKKEFTTYRLKNVMELKSGYSIRIYEILKRWQFINDVEIPLDELRKMVGATDKYLEYHNFKKRVLAPAQKEITEKTDLSFEYKEVKSGRKVVASRFFIRERPMGEASVISEIPHETSGIDVLYSPFLSRFAERGQPLPPKAFARIAVLAQQAFGADWRDELTKMIDDIFGRTDIREPLAFLTYVLNEKINHMEKGMDHSKGSMEKTRKAMRREKLPDWFAEYQKQFLHDIVQSATNGVYEDDEIERKRAELEARLQKYKR